MIDHGRSMRGLALGFFVSGGLLVLVGFQGCGGSSFKPETIEVSAAAGKSGPDGAKSSPKEGGKDPAGSEKGTNPEGAGDHQKSARAKRTPRKAGERLHEPGRGSIGALERAAKLDSRLKRDIALWDAEVERGLRAQADAQATGVEAMRALQADLLETVQTRPDPTVIDLYLVGRVHGKLGDVKTARAFFERALAENPQFLYGYEGLALCAGQEDGPDALANVEKAVAKAFEIWSEFPRGWLILGQARLNRLDPTGALEYLARIPRGHPVYTEGLINICRCHLLMNQPERAIVKLTDALERDADNLFYREMLGQALLDNGKTDEAEAAFRFVHERAPKRPLALLGLAKVDEVRGRREEAFERYKQVAENRDNTQDVRRDALAGIARLQGRATAPSAEAVLHQLQNSPDPAKRRSAAAMLWTVQGEIVVRAFLQRVNVKFEPDEGVRVYAVKALGAQALPRCIDVFRHLLSPSREPSKLVRGAAAHALSPLKAKYAPLEALVEALDDPEPYVFTQARASLEAIGQKRLRMDLSGNLDAADRKAVVDAWRKWLAERTPPEKNDSKTADPKEGAAKDGTPKANK